MTIKAMESPTVAVDLMGNTIDITEVSPVSRPEPPPPLTSSLSTSKEFYRHPKDIPDVRYDATTANTSTFGTDTTTTTTAAAAGLVDECSRHHHHKHGHNNHKSTKTRSNSNGSGVVMAAPKPPPLIETAPKFPIPKNILIKRGKLPFKSSSYYRQNDDEKILESLSSSSSSESESESESTSLLLSSSGDTETEMTALGIDKTLKHFLL